MPSRVEAATAATGATAATVVVPTTPGTAAVATDAPLSSISAIPAVPEKVTSAWATPAARTRDVVVRRMRFLYNTCPRILT